MQDQDILSGLVKTREYGRSLVGAFVQRGRTGLFFHEEDRQDDLCAAVGTLDRILACLRALPPNPCACVSERTHREHAEDLLCEIGDLLEQALVAEREARQSIMRRPQRPDRPVAGLTFH